MSTPLLFLHYLENFPIKMTKPCQIMTLGFLLLVLTFGPVIYHYAYANGFYRVQDNDAARGMEITSDRLDYCLKLDRLLTRKLLHPHSVPVGIMEDANLLQRRGLELCTQGHIRGGIERLRRGLVLLKAYKRDRHRYRR